MTHICPGRPGRVAKWVFAALPRDRSAQKQSGRLSKIIKREQLMPSSLSPRTDVVETRIGRASSTGLTTLASGWRPTAITTDPQLTTTITIAIISLCYRTDSRLPCKLWRIALPAADREALGCYRLMQGPGTLPHVARLHNASRGSAFIRPSSPSGTRDC